MDTRAETERILEVVISFASGGLFAVGLAVSGMTQPQKVIGFLDLAGDWDPSLALVMLGAVSVYTGANWLAKRRSSPLFGAVFRLPVRRDIDVRLLMGAAIFGVGWGLAGYCPGPGITSAAAGSTAALAFVAAMTAGMFVHGATQRTKRRGEPGSGAPDLNNVGNAAGSTSVPTSQPGAKMLDQVLTSSTRTRGDGRS